MAIAARPSICSSLSSHPAEGAPTLLRAARQAVAATAADLQEEDIPVGPRAAEIVVATPPEVVRAVVRPAEDLRPLAAILPQDVMAVDSSHAGPKPASSHRSPSGGSERSLLLSLSMQEERREPVPQQSVA